MARTPWEAAPTKSGESGGGSSGEAAPHLAALDGWKCGLDPKGVGFRNAGNLGVAEPLINRAGDFVDEGVARGPFCHLSGWRAWDDARFAGWNSTPRSSHSARRLRAAERILA